MLGQSNVCLSGSSKVTEKVTEYTGVVAETPNIVYLYHYDMLFTTYDVPKTGAMLLKVLNALLPFGDYHHIKPVLEIVAVVATTHTHSAYFTDKNPFEHLTIVKVDNKQMARIKAYLMGRCSGHRIPIRVKPEVVDNPVIRKIMQMFMNEKPYVDIMMCNDVTPSKLMEIINEVKEK